MSVSPIPAVPDAGVRGASGLTRYLLRVWMPDRPGALGAVASRIGAVGADVVAVEVVDRGGGQAIDEFEIELPADHLDLCLREVRSVDGVDLEEVREMASPRPDLRLAPFDAAVAFLSARSVTELAEVVAEHARRVLGGDWAAVCDTTYGTVHATAGVPPPSRWLGAYAMGRAPAEPLGRSEARIAVDVDRELAVSPLAGAPVVVIVSRVDVEVRPRERRILVGLADAAAARWREISGR